MAYFFSKRANEQFTQKKQAIHSFAHLSLAAWANRSWLLIFHEQPEQFAHGRSFDMSNLSDLLTVLHMSWAIWENRSHWLIWFERSVQVSKWVMREWANSQPWINLKQIVKKMCKQTTFSKWPVRRDGLCCDGWFQTPSVPLWAFGMPWLIGLRSRQYFPN